MAKTVKKPLKAAQKKAAKTLTSEKNIAARTLASKRLAIKKVKSVSATLAGSVAAAEVAAKTLRDTTSALRPHVTVNASAYVVETGVEKPARTRSSVASPYPFATMSVGSSFLVPAHIDRSIYTSEKEANEAQREELARVANRMSGATRRFTKRNAGVKLSVRTVEGGVRVWRDQ